MFTHLVLTIIGTDRPGLVQLVAGRVADHGGNWLESRLCHLGGQFAGIARVEVPGERVAGLQQALQHLLRAEATFRKIEVAFGARGGGGGGGGAGRDLASLFDLEDAKRTLFVSQTARVALQRERAEAEQLR